MQVSIVYHELHNKNLYGSTPTMLYNNDSNKSSRTVQISRIRSLNAELGHAEDFQNSAWISFPMVHLW